MQSTGMKITRSEFCWRWRNPITKTGGVGDNTTFRFLQHFRWVAVVGDQNTCNWEFWDSSMWVLKLSWDFVCLRCLGSLILIFYQEINSGRCKKATAWDKHKCTIVFQESSPSVCDSGQLLHTDVAQCHLKRLALPLTLRDATTAPRSRSDRCDKPREGLSDPGRRKSR